MSGADDSLHMIANVRNCYPTAATVQLSVNGEQLLSSGRESKISLHKINDPETVDAFKKDYSSVTSPEFRISSHNHYSVLIGNSVLIDNIFDIAKRHFTPSRNSNNRGIVSDGI